MCANTIGFCALSYNTRNRVRKKTTFHGRAFSSSENRFAYSKIRPSDKNISKPSLVYIMHISQRKHMCSFPSLSLYFISPNLFSIVHSIHQIFTWDWIFIWNLNISGFGEGSIRAASEIIHEWTGARAQRQLLLRRTKNVLIIIIIYLIIIGVGFGALSGPLSDQVSRLPETLPDQRGHHLAVHVWRRHDARFGRQLVGHDRLARRGIHQPHQIPVRLQLAGKYPKKCMKCVSVIYYVWYVMRCITWYVAAAHEGYGLFF